MPLQTIVYAINDVLLPSVVTIPLGVALQNFNATSSTPYTPVIAAKASQLDQLQTQTQGEALAPVFVQPATPPTDSALLLLCYLLTQTEHSRFIVCPRSMITTFHTTTIRILRLRRLCCCISIRCRPQLLAWGVHVEEQGRCPMSMWQSCSAHRSSSACD